MDKMLIIRCFVILIALVGAGLFFWWYKKRATSEQKKKVDTWLLGVVTEAQKEFGEDTGPLKFSIVYGAFVALFPELAAKIPVAVFETWVVAVKRTLVKMQAKNPKIDEYVKGTSVENEK